MPKPNLRAVDPAVEHPRDRAKREIKRFRANAERERLPICNQVCTGAPNLRVDEVIRKSERVAPTMDQKDKPYLIVVAISFLGLIALMFAMAYVMTGNLTE